MLTARPTAASPTARPLQRASSKVPSRMASHKSRLKSGTASIHGAPCCLPCGRPHTVGAASTTFSTVRRPVQLAPCASYCKISPLTRPTPIILSLVCRSLQPSLWRCHGCCGCIAESLCRLVCGHAAPWDTNLLRLQATHRGWPMAAVVRPAPVRSDLQRLLLQAGDGLGACASSHVLGRSAALAHRVDCNSKLRVALLRQLHCEPPPRGASARAVMRDAGGAQRTALAHAHTRTERRLMMSCVRHDHVRHDQLPLAPVCGWPRCGCQGRARGIAV